MLNRRPKSAGIGGIEGTIKDRYEINAMMESILI
jgi:hypothetical protein